MSFTQDFEQIEIDKFGYVQLPKIHIAPEWYTKVGLKEGANTIEFFGALVRSSYDIKKAEFKPELLSKYEQRINHELKILEELGFIDYCLLVWQVIEKAREFGAFIDYGRGSMVSSLCFYLLDITGADPIEHHLIFERFVNRARSKKEMIGGVMYLKGDLIADADLNLGPTRDKVKRWLHETYPGCLSAIMTLGTFTGKALVTDVYKCYDEVDPDEAKRISNMVEKNQGIVEDIEKMPEKSEEFKAWAESHPETYNICLSLRDLISQEGKHASGYLICARPLYGYVPLQLNKEGEVTCGLAKEDAAEFAIKLDLLGLSTNAILKRIEDVIPEKLSDIRPKLKNDPIIYGPYQNGRLLPYGLYQISADTAYRVLNKFRPKNLDELSDVSATARPGALAYVDDYAERKAVCPHPAFADILGPTRNVCLYQEQFLNMAMKLGFTGEEAEQIRRIVGKKKVDEINAWKQRIYETAKKNGFDDRVGDVLWKILEDSSRYSFNASHSLATSMTSALTTYLKYKYPLQFYWSCLCESKSQSGRTPQEEVAKVEREMHHFGIKILPPDLALSDIDFTMENGNIRYGLGFIKGISDKTIEKVKMFRSKDKPNKISMFNALRESGLSVGVGAALAQAGCLQSVGASRIRTVLELQTYLSSSPGMLSDKERQLVNEYAPRFKYDILDTLAFIKDAKNEKGKPLIKPERWTTFMSKYSKYKQIWEQNRKHEKFANYYFEKLLLGFSYSGTLMSIFSEHFENLMPLDEINTEVEGVKVRGIGTILEKRTGISKNKNKYVKYRVADERGEITLMIFNTVGRGSTVGNIDSMKEKNGGSLPDEDNIVVFEGTKKDGNTVFAHTIVVQDEKIYTKLADLKELEKDPK